MNANDFEEVVKIVLLGNGNVGKSSLIRKYCRNGEFTPVYNKTIGTAFQECELRVNNEQCRLMIWDCAGQEDFDEITREYYKDADAVALVFAANDRHSFEMVKGWKRKFEAAAPVTDNSMAMVLVQNKCDLPIGEVQIQAKEAEDLARELKVRIYRVSVRDNSMVDEVFQYLAVESLRKRRLKSQQQPPINQKQPQSNLKLQQIEGDLQKTVDLFQTPTRQTPPNSAIQSKGKSDCIIS